MLQIKCVQSFAVGVGERVGVVEGGEIDTIYRSLPRVDCVLLADVL